MDRFAIDLPQMVIAALEGRVMDEADWDRMEIAILNLPDPDLVEYDPAEWPSASARLLSAVH